MIISRSAPFAWPNIPLDRVRGTGPAKYIVLASWDDDGNFHPLFKTRSTATQGDLIGGALDGMQQAVIEVGPSSVHPNGQVVDNIAVTILLPVMTEMPVSHLGSQTQPLTSEAIFPRTFDPAVMEESLHSMTSATLEFPDLSSPQYSSALDVAGLDLNNDPLARGIYVKTLDGNGDGTPDPHPVLGPVAGLPLLTPAVVMQRARTPAEIQAAIPEVIILSNPRSGQEVRKDSLQLLVPPAAVVQLDPFNPSCQVAYAAPGNPTLAFEAAPSACAELPTGAYNVNVVHGLAGAQPTMTSSAVSQTGLDLLGGQFAGQIWQIPNELGPPDSYFDPTAKNHIDPPNNTGASLTIPEQGPAGRFWLVDSDTETGSTRENAQCSMALDPLTLQVRTINYPEIPPVCCAPVIHLCGLPLCAAKPREGAPGAIRELTQLDSSGKATCVPFEMPRGCCP